METPTTYALWSGAREILALDGRWFSSVLTICPGRDRARDFPGTSSMLTVRMSFRRVVKPAMVAE